MIRQVGVGLEQLQFRMIAPTDMATWNFLLFIQKQQWFLVLINVLMSFVLRLFPLQIVASIFNHGSCPKWTTSTAPEQFAMDRPKAIQILVD